MVSVAVARAICDKGLEPDAAIELRDGSDDQASGEAYPGFRVSEADTSEGADTTASLDSGNEPIDTSDIRPHE